MEYNKEQWKGVWNQNERWKFQKWASGYCTTPHMQDWIAVKILKDEGAIDSDCVIVPGHSGDFVAGGHIPSVVFTQEKFEGPVKNFSIISNALLCSPIIV